jgi:hypothetical protein
VGALRGVIPNVFVDVIAELHANILPKSTAIEFALSRIFHA